MILCITQIVRERASEKSHRQWALNDYFAELEQMEPIMKRCVLLLGVGLSATAIVEQLSITRRTVEKHKHDALKKLKLKNALELGQLLCRLQDGGYGDFCIFHIG
ncbi:MAG: LuxR C-terminal-related transcriptional regulator [Planctomycetota bacterium]